MIAALDPQEQVSESVVKLRAARANLEHAIVFDEHDGDVFVLQLVSDVVRALESVDRVIQVTELADAAAIVGDVRARRLVRGDRDTADRLAELHRLLTDEDEYLDGIEQHALPATNRDYPPGATIAWLFRHDPHTRRIRELRGLSLPEAGDACDG